MTTQDILTHHLTAFGNNNLEAIMEDYTEASQVFTQDGIVQGLEAIRNFFAHYFITIPTGSAFEMKQLQVQGNLAYIVWTSNSAVAEIPLGTDTFIIEEGKIALHTVAAVIHNK